jgi:hypothetical protein
MVSAMAGAQASESTPPPLRGMIGGVTSGEANIAGRIVPDGRPGAGYTIASEIGT